MIDILAQEAANGTNIGVWIGTVIGGIALVLGGGTGGRLIERRKANGSSQPAEQRGVCPVHDQFAQLLEERKQHSDEKLDEVKADVSELKADVKTGFEGVFKKIDIMHGLMSKNGQKD